MRNYVIRFSLWCLRKFKYATTCSSTCLHFGGFRSRAKWVRLCDLDPYHTGPHKYASVLVENMLPERKKYVLAANHQHFLFWCRQNNIDHRSSNVRFVSNVSQIAGLEPDYAEFIYYETWRQHPQSAELEMYIKMIESKV